MLSGALSVSILLLNPNRAGHKVNRRRRDFGFAGENLWRFSRNSVQLR
jgi:hypothetical protein